jgi:hypothetical protein
MRSTGSPRRVFVAADGLEGSLGRGHAEDEQGPAAQHLRGGEVSDTELFLLGVLIGILPQLDLVVLLAITLAKRWVRGESLIWQPPANGWR